MPGIPIGQILVLRNEFATVAKKPHESPAVRRRAEILQQVCDELIAHREEEAIAHGE